MQIRDLECELRGVEAQEYLKGDLRATLEHRAFVSVLTDPDERAALGLRLFAADLPEVPADLNLPVANREEWARHLFDPDGNLVVPQKLPVANEGTRAMDARWSPLPAVREVRSGYSCNWGKFPFWDWAGPFCSRPGALTCRPPRCTVTL